MDQMFLEFYKMKSTKCKHFKFEETTLNIDYDKLGLSENEVKRLTADKHIILTGKVHDLCVHLFYLECDNQIIGPLNHGFESACKLGRKLLQKGKTITIFTINCFNKKEILVDKFKRKNFKPKSPVGFQRYMREKRLQLEQRHKTLLQEAG